MPAVLPDDLKPVLEACKTIGKSEDGEFSCKWLRLAGFNFHPSKLTRLVELGYLRVRHNGIVRRGTSWYSVA